MSFHDVSCKTTNLPFPQAGWRRPYLELAVRMLGRAAPYSSSLLWLGHLPKRSYFPSLLAPQSGTLSARQPTEPVASTWGRYCRPTVLLGWVLGGKIGISINGGTPKSSILMGFSLINHPFMGTSVYGTPQIANRHTLVLRIFPNEVSRLEARIPMRALRTCEFSSQLLMIDMRNNH